MPDVTAPIINGAMGNADSTTTADLSVVTDEGNGEVFFYVSTSGTEPSAADIKSGFGAVYHGSDIVTANGTQNHAATGLTPSTNYYLHCLHRDSSGNDSNIDTSAQFSTPSAGGTGILDQSGGNILDQSGGTIDDQA